MERRHKALLVASMAIGMPVIGAGIWLYHHRAFADPTWLDRADALTVQAAWVQAFFSVAAIVAAIVIGEIQHNRTRAQVAEADARRSADESAQKLRAATVMVYAMRETRTAVLQYTNLLTGYDFKHPERPASEADIALLLPLIEQGREGWPLLHSYVLAELRALDINVYEDVARAIHAAHALHRKAGFVIQSLRSRRWSGLAITGWFERLRGACDGTAAELLAAMRTIDRVHGLVFPEFEEQAAEADAGGAPPSI